MKVNKIYYIVGMVSLLSMGSCSGVLDIAPDGRIDIDDVWEDNDMTGAYLNGCYTYYANNGGLNNYYFQTDPFESVSDDLWDCDAEVETSLSHAMAYNGVASSSSHPMTQFGGLNNNSPSTNYRTWANCFEGVRKCNMFLTHIDNAKVSSETNRARWRAEARFLRGAIYSELVQYYGALTPILTRPNMFDDDFSFVQMYNGEATRAQGMRKLVDFIIGDIDTAMMEEGIPWRNTSSSDNGRVTKALGLAIKSRLALFAASPLNEGAMSWEEAYQINHAALQQLRDNGYELYTTCSDNSTYNIFGKNGQIRYDKGIAAAAALSEYFCVSADYSTSPRDKETIFEARSNGGHSTYYVNGIGFQGGYRCGMVPTQELVDQYENVEYTSTEATASYFVVDLERPYIDHTHLVPNYDANNPVYDAMNPYVDRDPRFYATVTYNECVREAYWKNAETDGRSGQTWAGEQIRRKNIWTNKEDDYTGIHTSERTRTRTGYYMNKFLHPTAGGNNEVGAVKFKMYRLAEVILNTAECAIESGRIQEGMQLINEIRARAAMPPLPESPTTDEARRYLRHERRIEFVGEEIRFNDLRRWTEPDEDMTDVEWSTAMEISWLGDDASGTPIYTYTRRAVRLSARQCYSNKWLWVPIPLEEQNKLGTLTGQQWQNPGW